MSFTMIVGGMLLTAVPEPPDAAVPVMAGSVFWLVLALVLFCQVVPVCVSPPVGWLTFGFEVG